jgi:hypothetical protein
LSSEVSEEERWMLGIPRPWDMVGDYAGE